MGSSGEMGKTQVALGDPVNKRLEGWCTRCMAGLLLKISQAVLQLTHTEVKVICPAGFSPSQ